MADDAWEGSYRNISITLKHGAEKRDDKGTWSVFRGSVSEIRADLLEYMGWDDEGLSLSELVTNAETQLRAVGNLSSLGPRVRGRKVQDGQADEAQANVWAAAAQKADEPVHEHQDALDALEAAETVEALKDVYAEYTKAFEDKDVLAAYKAKGKALSEAAA